MTIMNPTFRRHLQKFDCKQTLGATTTLDEFDDPNVERGLREDELLLLLENIVIVVWCFGSCSFFIAS